MKGGPFNEPFSRVFNRLVYHRIACYSISIWYRRGGEFRVNFPILITKQELLIPHELMPVELRLKYSHYLKFRNYDYCPSAFFIVPPDRSHYVLADMLEYVMSVTLE